MSSFEYKHSSYGELYDKIVYESNYSNLISPGYTEIFPVTQEIPESLKYNLISEDRVIRLIKSDNEDRNILLRGFYFQLLKLCFQLEDQDEGENYKKITKNILFDQSMLYNEKMHKNIQIISQFFQKMQTHEEDNFDQCIAKYNQIDLCLVSILAEILDAQNNEQKSDNPEHILQQLCQLFEVTLMPTHPYYKFEELDIYLYYENSRTVYIVYSQENFQENSQFGLSKKSKSQISKSEEQSNHSSQKDKQVLQGQNSHSSLKGSELSLKKTTNDEEGAYKQKKKKLSNNNQSSNYNDLESKDSVLSANNQQMKKGIIKKSPFYQITAPYQQKKKVMIDQNHNNEVISNHLNSNQTDMFNSNYVNNSMSNYYDGLYGQGSHQKLDNSNYSSLSKNDTIMNIFGDLMKSGKHQASHHEQALSKTKKNIESNEKILQIEEQIEKQDQSQIKPDFAKKINTINTLQMIQNAKSVNSYNQGFHSGNMSDFQSNQTQSKRSEQNSENQNKYSLLQKQMEQGERLNYNFPNLNKIESHINISENMNHSKKYESSINKEHIVNFDEEDERGQQMFYKPKKSYLKPISQVTASKQTISGSRYPEKPSDDSKGSIYRQFSDTRILKLLKEPHKTKVQITRNRFKGQHFFN